MRKKRDTHRAAALLRQGMALSVAVALVCSMAFPAGALETDVLNEETGLIETWELDDDEYLVEDAFAEEPTAEEEEDPPVEDEQTTEETPEEAEEKTPEEETKEDSKEEKDTEDDIKSDDFSGFDEETIDSDAVVAEWDEFSASGDVALFATEDIDYYFYNSKIYKTCTVDSDSQRTYSNEQNKTLTNLINDATSSTTIRMDSTYDVANGSKEEWNPTAQVTLLQVQGVQPIHIYGELTLSGNLTIDASKANNTSLYLKEGSPKLTINKGVTVKGCVNGSGNGGIVYMSAGEFTMNGGSLIGGEVSSCGGAVYMSDGTFEMKDGSISGGKAANGGGVYMAGGTFNMTGGTIGDETDDTKGNTASSDGGGVCVAGGTFTMEDGSTIANNQSGVGGAGVAVSGGSNFYLKGGEISKNKHSGNSYTSPPCGGGIVVRNGNLYMSGGRIVKNTYVQSSAISMQLGTLEISGGTIADNTNIYAKEVSINSAGTTVKITGGSIEEINDQEHPEHIKDDKEHQVVQYSIKNFTPWSNYHFTVTYTLDDVEYTYNCGKDVYADDDGNIYLWLPKGSEIKSSTGDFPRISVTVPLTMLVTVNGDGTCGITTNVDREDIDDIPIDLSQAQVATYAAETGNGTITNNSNVPIYLTSVTFTWNTTGGTTSDGASTPAPSEIFTNWSDNEASRPTIKLNKKPGTVNGNSITWSYSDLNGGLIPANSGTFDLTWSFDLNGNSISQALNAGVSAPIGTIVYTVSYQNPGNTSSQSLDDDFLIYEYENGGDAA